MPESAPRDLVLGKRVRAFARSYAGVHEDDAAALHRTRVASRRLREVLPLVGLNRADARKIVRRLKRVTRRLGTVRELDVLMAVIRELHGKPDYPPMPLRELGAAVAAARSAARERLAAKLPPARLKKLARRLQRAVQYVKSTDQQRRRSGTLGPKQAWLWALDARSVRRAVGLQSMIHRTGALYVPEQLHELRIAVKKLRYAEELRAEVRHCPTHDVAVLTTAQNVLGRLHDLEMLGARARDVQSLVSSSHLMAWHRLGLLVRTLERDCRRLHGRFMRHRTKLLAVAVRIAARTDRHAQQHDRAAS